MKLLEFFSINEAIEAGTFVGVRFDRETQNNLVEYMEEVGIDEPVPASKLHTTVALSKAEPFPWIPRILDIRVNPATYEFALFGPDKDVLVLKFESPELTELHYEIRKKFRLPWDFDSYSPHVTLSYDGENDIKDLSLPTFPLIITKEYVEPFSPD